MTLTTVGIKSATDSALTLNGSPDVPSGSSAPYTVKVWYSDGTTAGTDSATLQGAFATSSSGVITFTPTGTMPSNLNTTVVGILKLESGNMLLYILIALALYYFLVMKKR
jgi:hypothetical protein